MNHDDQKANCTYVPDSLLTTKEAAQYLRCSESLLAHARMNKTGPRWHRIGKRNIVYKFSDLLIEAR